MSAIACFICNSEIDTETNNKSREEYFEIVGVKLSQESNLCFLCIHVLNKITLFRSICLKRSLHQPVTMSTKGVLCLQRSNVEIITLSSEDDIQTNQNIYNFTYNYSNDEINEDICNKSIKIDDDNEFDNYFDENEMVNENDCNIETDQADVDINTDLMYKEEFETKLTEINLNISNENNDTIINGNTVKDTDISNSDIRIKIKKSEKSKKKIFKKVILSLEEQKAELEALRREKKYIEAEFKCYNCALGFLFKDTYQAHMMRHEESNGEYQCPICTLRFATATLLRAHTSMHTERYDCSKCGASLRPRSKKTHGCGKKNRTQSVACQICGNIFRDANGLQQHLRRVHASKTAGRPITCGVCGVACKSQSALRTHMIKHINRKFPCASCPAAFGSPYTRASHAAAHSPARRAAALRCAACARSYGSRKSLVAHTRRAAGHQLAVFECPICSRACPNERSLASHVQTVHSATKDFECSLCPARYTSRKSLVRHIGSHNRRPEVKTAICHICGGSFKGNNKLNRHLREVCKKEKLEDMSTIYDE